MCSIIRPTPGTELGIEVIGTEPLAVGYNGETIVRGSLPAVVRWAAGRGAFGITSNGPNPAAPRWL